MAPDKRVSAVQYYSLTTFDSVNHLLELLRQAIENEEKLLHEITLPGVKFEIKQVRTCVIISLYPKSYRLSIIIVHHYIHAKRPTDSAPSRGAARLHPLHSGAGAKPASAAELGVSMWVHAGEGASGYTAGHEQSLVQGRRPASVLEEHPKAAGMIVIWWWFQLW